MQSKARLQATGGGTADEVEAAFYDALACGDVERLMACWSDEDGIVCVHPGGARLVGAAAIRASFEALLARGGGGLKVTPLAPQRVEAPGSSMHSLVERLEMSGADGERRGYLIATNVYHRTAQGWRMVLHHASPGALDEGRLAEAPARRLH